MQFPWVSRHRLTAAEKALEAANAERRELLERLLDGAPERRQLRETVRRVEAQPAEETYIEPDQPISPPPADQGAVVQFTTPFDRIEKRFDQARANGQPIDARFKARA